MEIAVLAAISAVPAKTRAVFGVTARVEVCDWWL
jgi:hypothetical protein